MNRLASATALGVIALALVPHDARGMGPVCASIGPCIEQCKPDHSSEAAKASCKNTFPQCGEPTLAYWVWVPGCGPANWEQVICNWNPQ